MPVYPGAHKVDYPAATMFTAAMNRVQQVPFVKLNAGDTANAWSAALPAALAWLWQQLAPPDLRVQFPVRATTGGLISTIPVPPVKAHYPGLCVPAKRPAPRRPPVRQAPAQPGAEGVNSTRPAAVAAPCHSAEAGG